MLPIDKLEFKSSVREDGALIIFANLKKQSYSVISPHDRSQPDIEEHTKDLMRRKLWGEIYGDLLAPLDELTFLVRHVANGNPSAYPEAARIEELTKKIYELLDWRKQLAAKQEGEKK